MSHLYFAYGSNLLTQRLTARCPTARPVGRATLDGHRVGFAKYSVKDRSAKATILAEPGRIAEGVVFELGKADLRTLDRFEGVGFGYDRLDRIGVTLGGEAVDAVSYIASDPQERHKPYDWYLALILAGGLQHRLNAAGMAALALTGFERDTHETRPGRIAALEALRAAGHHAWERLLSPQGESPELPAAE